MATDQFSISNTQSASFLRLTRSCAGAVSMVTISQHEYKELIQAKHEYGALRQALLSGGVDPATLDILINTNLPPTPPDSSNDDRALSKKQRNVLPTTFAPQPPRLDDFNNQEHVSTFSSDQRRDKCHTPDLLTPLSEAGDDHEIVDIADPYKEKQPSWENNYEDRSLVLRGLAPLTTLLDITKAIRGGALLNIYVRPRERMAHVSFVDSLAAENFVVHAKRNDVYVRGKRVTVGWDEHQTYLPGHVARRIACNGASRNLVIRFAKPEMTAEAIVEDLEHIHRLQVVNVTHENGHVFISTNSVCHALTAKTCMHSQLRYKNTKIEFYPDECDQLLPPTSPRKYHQKSLPARAHGSRYRNRFDLLRSQSEDDLHMVQNFPTDIAGINLC